MIEDRVGELRVRVRTDIPDAAAIRPAAERIVRAALDRCASLLEERAPGRVVLIRRLPLRWRLDESVLDDESQVEELARAAADTIERITVPSMLDPPATSEGAVLFDDEAHLRASHLLAIARGRPAWFHAALDGEEAGDPLAALAAPQRRATAHATLVRLAGGGVLAEVLAAQPPSAVAVLAVALGFAAQPIRRTRSDGEPVEAGPGPADIPFAGSAIVDQLAAIASRWPALASATRSLALRVHAAVLLDVDVEAPQAIVLAAAVLDDKGGSSPAPRIESARIPHRDAVVPDDRASTDDRAPHRDAIGSEDRASTSHRAPLDEAHDPTTATAEAGESTAFVATRCTGLFYLLDRVQELDLAESLWKACLPEGAVFAAAASALLGPGFAGDAAPALFGGVDATVACPEVTPEQHAEVAISTCAALAAALPRHGLADIPPAVVTLVNHSAGRLLVAAAEGSPFAFFAWPAATPEMLSTGLCALLDTWPHRGVLTATPALTTLDTSGRLRPRRDATPVPLLLPEAPSAAAAALLALVAGAPCMLFAARAGAPSPDAVEAFVARHLGRPARVHIGPERMDVVLDADDLDFDARRAGLDRDPGWLPWLRRSVRFVFEEHDTAASPLPAVSA